MIFSFNWSFSQKCISACIFFWSFNRFDVLIFFCTYGIVANNGMACHRNYLWQKNELHLNQIFFSEMSKYIKKPIKKLRFCSWTRIKHIWIWWKFSRVIVKTNKHRRKCIHHYFDVGIHSISSEKPIKWHDDT